MKSIAVKLTLSLPILLAALIAAPPCSAAQGEFRFSIFVEDETVNPLPEDLTVAANGTALSVSAIEPLPVDAAVLLVLETTFLSTNELKQARQSLLETIAQLKKSSVPWTVAIIDSRQSASLHVSDATLLQSTLTTLASERNGAANEFSPDLFLTGLDRISDAIKAAADQHAHLRVVLVGHDAAFVFDERDEVERQLNSNLIHLITNRGVSLYLLDFGTGGGFFSALASQVGGRIIGANGQKNNIAGLLSSDQPRNYLVTVKQEKARYYFRPLPLSLRWKNPAPPGKNLSAPKFFWPLPDEQKLPTYMGLREARTLRRQMAIPAKPEELAATLSRAQRIVGLSPFTLSDRLQLIRFYERTQTFDQAHQLIEQSLALFPDSWELPYKRGALYENQKDYPRAIEWFELALALKPKGHEINLRLARVNAKAKRPVEAVARYDKILGTELDNASLRLDLARMHWLSGSVEQAEKEAQSAIKFDRQILPAYDLLLEVYQKKRDYKASLKTAHDALAENPQHYPALHSAGLTLTELGRHTEAIFFLEIALSGAPRDFDLHYALYRSFNELNRIDNASKALQAALRIDEKQPFLYVDLAKLYQKKGAFLSAGKALEEGAVKTRGSFDLHHALACWHERRGQLERAIASYKAAAELAAPEEKRKIAKQIGLLTLLKGASQREALNSFTEAGFQLPSDLDGKINAERQGLNSEESEKNAFGKLSLPGGVEPVLRFAPHLRGRPKDVNFVGALFTYLLAEESNSQQPMSSPRLQFVAFCREYLKFKNWLAKERLFSPVLTLNFTARKEDQKFAAAVLSYFEIKVKYRRDQTSGEEILFLEADEQGNEERQLLLKLLGFSSSLIKGNTSFKFILNDEELPVSLGSDYWSKDILGQKSAAPNEVLLHWIEEPEAMRLYTVLESLPVEARLWLARFIPAGELLKDLLPALTAFGGMLKFNSDGSLLIPGGEEGEKIWTHMVGVLPSKDPRGFLKKLFAKDEGRLIYFLAALSQAPPEAVSFIHATPARFSKFYSQTGEYKVNKRAWPGRNYFDLADLLWLLEVERGSVSFPGTERMWAIAASSGGNKSTGDLTRLDKLMRKRVKFTGDEEVLLALLKAAAAGNKISGVRKYAAFKHLAEKRPDLLDERTGLALEMSYARFGGQYPLFADLGMDSDTLLKFLNRLEEFEKITNEEKQRTMVALFQSTLVLLQLFERNGVINKDEVRKLCVEFLDLSYPPHSPGAGAFEISVFLSRRLLPLLDAKLRSVDAKDEEHEECRFVRGLAGLSTDFSYMWNDQVYELNFAKWEAKRIRGFLDGQSIPALKPLLDLFANLQQLAGAPSKTAFEQIHLPSQSLSDPQIDSKRSDAYRKAVVHTDAKRLHAELQKLGHAAQRNKPSQMGERLLAVYEELAPYLAESITGLVYAAAVTEDDIVSMADENFVRKHNFALDEYSRKLGQSTWAEPDVVRDEELGAHVSGSLVGLSAVLAKIRGRQVEGGTRTRFSDEAFPVKQRVATALINTAELSEETIEYAAICMTLAETLLSSAVIDERIQNFVDNFITRHLGAKRALLVRKSVRAGEPGRAAASILPSELFHLGDEFYRLHAKETNYQWQFSPINRLDELKGKVNATGLGQLGFPVGSWYGVNTLSLERLAPIESVATYWEPLRLAERSCELKLQLSRLFWRAGVPAALFKPVAERVVERALKKVGQSSLRDWGAVTGVVSTIDEEMVFEVITEIARTGLR